MKITILYDNTVKEKSLTSDWGFSCLVQAYGRSILFDTGTNFQILLDNMNKLNKSPRDIDEIFISHAHNDHTGGLSELLKLKSVKVYCPDSAPKACSADEAVRIKTQAKIHEHIYSTGTLQSKLRDIEQSMVVDTKNGLVVIVGCSHPGVRNIIEAATAFGKIHALIGGLHGFNDFELLSSLEFICPTHCTKHIAEIKSREPKKFVKGGVGQVIEFPEI